MSTFKVIRSFVLLFIGGAFVMSQLGLVYVSVIAASLAIPGFMVYDEKKYDLEQQKKSSRDSRRKLL